MQGSIKMANIDNKNDFETALVKALTMLAHQGEAPIKDTHIDQIKKAVKKPADHIEDNINNAMNSAKITNIMNIRVITAWIYNAPINY